MSRSLYFLNAINSELLLQALQPKIYMKDRDTKKNSYPFDYFPLNDPIYKTDFELRDNKGNIFTSPLIVGKYNVYC